MEPGTASRLATQRGINPSAGIDYGDAEGEDNSGSVAVTIDSTGWVKEIQLLALPDELRSARGLFTAISSAISSARWVQIGREAQARVVKTRDANPQQDAVSERKPFVAPELPLARHLTSVEATHEAFRIGGAPKNVRDDRRTKSITGASIEGEVTVTMEWLEGFTRIDAREPWLACASLDMVTFALREAFGEAYTEGNKTL